MNAPLTIRPRRSVLYVPGANPRALAKAADLPADGLIFDLEDAVLPEAKPAARAAVIDRVAGGGFGQQEIVIRINGLDTTWGIDDLLAAATSRADAVLLPKVESPETVVHAATLLDQQHAPAGMRIWIMAETPRGVLDLQRIVASSGRLAVVVMGTADLAKAMRLDPGPERSGLLPALSHCVLAARAQGLDILDGIFGDIGDHPGFRAACQQGKALGFDGKSLIHPGQVDTANEIFGVPEAQAEAARKLLSAWEAAAKRGSGIAVMQGRMIEALHAEEARRVLTLHEAIRQRNDAPTTG
ncbi:MAG: CoA ester lyase [Gammaproteobacteria bacterium]|nr:CoA ester lyase [Gammaproteobacteria bacterium]